MISSLGFVLCHVDWGERFEVGGLLSRGLVVEEKERSGLSCSTCLVASFKSKKVIHR